MTPSDLSSLAPFTSILSLVLNEKGGILDDAILTKHSDETYYMVSNAGQRDTVIKWFQDKLRHWNSTEQGRKGPVELELMDGWGLLALQGTCSSYLYVHPMLLPR
jgi:aminomethyltransferase